MQHPEDGKPTPLARLRERYMGDGIDGFRSGRRAIAKEADCLDRRDPH